MRCLERNKRKFFYALYKGKTAVVDSHGYKTGEYEITYGRPVMMRANISPSQGSVGTELFGINTNYSKVIVTADMNCPIAEDTAIWIDRMPCEKNNYRVVQVAKSLNQTAYAIDEVDAE